MVVVGGLVFIGGAVWWAFIVTDVYDHLDSHLMENAYSFGLCGLGNAISAHAVFAFFEHTNRTAVIKFRAESGGRTITDCAGCARGAVKEKRGQEDPEPKTPEGSEHSHFEFTKNPMAEEETSIL